MNGEEFNAETRRTRRERREDLSAPLRALRLCGELPVFR
jgi:hypothetical protein